MRVIRIPKRKKNKYHNAKCTVLGKSFHSKKEGKRYLVLKSLEENGTISGLELQPKFDFPMGFSYFADFKYIKDGKTIVEDVKGVKTDVFKLKMKCFKYFYTEYELILT